MKGKTPEDQELNRKLTELSDLENKLAQRELDLATLQAELNVFESTYLRTVGVRLAELDKIEAKIAEVKARLKPKDKKMQDQAMHSRNKAQNSAEAIGISKEIKRKKFKPSEKLKKLYREVAKNLHPDLAVNEKERLRREKLMAEANIAYENGDEVKLRAILDEWESSPESFKGEGTAAELVRVIRKISQIKKRLRSIEIEVTQLKKSDLFKIKRNAEKAEDKGQDLLSELASQVDEDIAVAHNRLAKLSRKQ